MPDASWSEGLAEDYVEHIKFDETVQFEGFGFVRLDKPNADVKEFWFAHK